MAQVGDVGIAIGGVIKRNGVVVDISGAGTMQLIAKAPSGTSNKTWTASHTTDGTDGALRFVTSAATDLDEAGFWEVQARIVIGGDDWKTRITHFEVKPNL